MSQEEALRRPWKEGPEGSGGGAAGWLALSDDDLLFRIEALGPQHDSDAVLMEVVRSERHFFIRQEAAKRIRNSELLKGHSGDRHIGQILVRVMNRAEDVAYLALYLASDVSSYVTGQLISVSGGAHMP